MIKDGVKERCCDPTQAGFTNGLVRSCCKHHKIDDVSTGNDMVVAKSRKPAPLKRTNVATQQLHGVGLSPKALLKRILGPTAACFPLWGRNQHIEEREGLARAGTPQSRLTASSSRRHAQAEPRVLPNSKFLRLSDNEAEAVVAVFEQILVAKPEPWAERSNDSKLRQDRFHRGMKRRAGQRLEINSKAAPSVLAPFSDWITLHSPAPLAVFTGTTRSLKSKTTRLSAGAAISHVKFCK
jgi:hypothetical protein